MALFSKIVLAGDGAVGKTALRRAFMGTTFSSDYLMTIGADFSTKEIQLPSPRSETVKFQIWDLAGQMRFSEVRTVYYNGASGAVLIYDCTRPESFENTPKWLMEIKKNSKSPIPVVLLANKVDLKDKVDFSIEKSQGQALAQAITRYYFDERAEMSIPFFETSAKTGLNVDAAFYALADIIIQNRDRQKQKRS
ncbi:MAG TPA: GTP-binding protein [Candidatus Hodarchaeales archaeon]|nr:GTP-binding protein [Candidatus Hodarchaeales archaeon]